MPSETIQPSLIYRSFFLYVEPFCTFAGAYTAFFHQQLYLRLTHSRTAPRGVPPLSNRIVLNQLANLYMLFAINEALVLRATNNRNVWRALIAALLIADIGHLWSVHPIGSRLYWDVTNWNAIDWGNLGFVYLGALIRISFLLQTSSKSTIFDELDAEEPQTPRRSSRKAKPTQKLKD